MEFLASLIKTPVKNKFLTINCTHVIADYWIYEGDNELLEDELSNYGVIAEGCVTSLNGLTQRQLIDCCIDWYGVDLKILCTN